MKNAIIVAITALSVFYVSAPATIIDIPDDYPTIQQGIDASTDGDTVLVQPGTYVENINFNGHNIALGSLFLTTGDTTYIAQTLIDGDSAGTVVTFDSRENSTAVLSGFSIINGKANYGGGIECYNAVPEIRNNLLIGNYATYTGGGIDCFYADPRIIDNTIKNNICGRYGGGIHCNYAAPEISRNMIDGNSAFYGAGISCRIESSPLISGNRITGNTSSTGAIYLNRSNPSIIENLITGNVGNGVDSRYSEPVLTRNFIKGNTGSGISLDRSDALIEQNIITENSLDDYGAGIWCGNSYPQIINNSIAYNFYSQGGGIYCWYCSPIVINTIIWGNSASIARSGDQLPVISFSDIQGGYEGEGNIDINPHFVGMIDGEFNICDGSPCIDSGDPNLTDPDGSRSDIGVYYSDHPDCSSADKWFVSVAGDDLNGDGSENNPFRTIQRGIEMALHRDTIIVENGEYFENVHFSGKNIVLASRYIYSHNSSDISNTIIDVDSAGTVVTFEYGEDDQAALIGFTVTGGDDCGIVCYRSSPAIIHNRVVNNVGFSGAGIYCRYSRAVVAFNDISYNISTADQGWGAGGLYLFESDARIENNMISYNTGDGRGGGIYCLRSDPYVSNNIIYSNESYSGGGFYCGGYSVPSIINNVFYGNSAYRGGGFYNDFNANPRLINSVLWDDTASYLGDEIYVANGSVIPRYCDIEGGWGGVGIIDADPLFRDPLGLDFHLMSTECDDPFESPCIDAGDPDSIDGYLDCLWGLGTIRSDMGAYGSGDSTMVGIEVSELVMPEKTVLFQNYPNPFNAYTTIRYYLAEDSDVEIRIYDVLGRLLEIPLTERQGPGTHSIVWEAGDFPSGIYFYSIDIGAVCQTKKCILLK